MKLKQKSGLVLFAAGLAAGTVFGTKWLEYVSPPVMAEAVQSALPSDGTDKRTPPAAVLSLGEIVDMREMPENNLTAWLIRAPNGRQMTFYTTADGKNIFSGTVWDLATKQNINQVFDTTDSVGITGSVGQSVQEVVQTDGGSSLLGKYTGEIPEAIKALDSLGGPKIGNGGPGETLYVIIDPRCPYCHQAYDSLKPYMDKGVTIKWIPTVALGQPEQGLPQANAVLHARTRAELDKIMTDPKAYPRALEGKDGEDLQRNLSFMFQAFEQNGGQAGVPAAFFVDKNTGQPRMMMGLSEEAVIQAILGKL
ncbi:hypothetical protein [Neisseria elongata]|jgi:hypothetical protein|uniref:hypothetical protein n=1 Tax=Neisseria elongata TaxID=495 RepID=UPI000D303ED0|nr:hypothetical protein [Neisseria elongata]